MRRTLRNTIGAGLLSILSTASLAHAQQTMSAEQVACEQAKTSYLTSTIQAQAPNSTRNTSLIVTPSGITGEPAGSVILDQSGTKAEQQLGFSTSPTTYTLRDPAAAQQPSFLLQTLADRSDSFVNTTAENVLKLYGNPDGQGARTLLSNITNQKPAETVSGPAAANVTQTCATYGPNDQHLFGVMALTARGVVCNNAPCDEDGDYSTVLGLDRDTTPGVYTFKLDAYDVHAGVQTPLGTMQGRIKATPDATTVVKSGLVEIVSNTLPSNVTGEIRIIDPQAPGQRYHLDQAVRATTSGPTSVAFDWYNDVLKGTAYEAVGTGCVPTESTICLGTNERFKVQGWMKDFSNPPKQFPMQIAHVNGGRNQSTDSAVLYAFGENNWEVLIKEIDACGLNDKFWIFYAATTNTNYQITVTDTQTDAVKVYNNLAGVTSPAITDTGAFNCP